MKQRIIDLEREASAATKDGVRLKVSTKGALQLNGIGRFPVTLYASQWRVVLAAVPQIEATWLGIS
jgi:hypothetical protein